MRDEAERVDLQPLGVDDRGVSAEAVLYADGDVTIQDSDNTGLVLDQEQAQKLAAFLVDHMGMEVGQR